MAAPAARVLAQDSANYHEHSREPYDGAGLPAPKNGLQFVGQSADPAQHPAGIILTLPKVLVNQIHAGQHRGARARALTELSVKLPHLPVDDSRNFLNMVVAAVGSYIVITAKDVNDN